MIAKSRVDVQQFCSYKVTTNDERQESSNELRHLQYLTVSGGHRSGPGDEKCIYRAVYRADSGQFILNPNLVSVLVGTKDMMVDVFSSHSSTSIIFILLMLGGLFYLIEKAGGLKGFTHFMIAKRSVVKSRVGAELFTWLIGVLMFLDGTMSVMITGAIARPFTKAFRISPEKTAWIVHSTADAHVHSDSDCGLRSVYRQLHRGPGYRGSHFCNGAQYWLQFLLHHGCRGRGGIYPVTY